MRNAPYCRQLPCLVFISIFYNYGALKSLYGERAITLIYCKYYNIIEIATYMKIVSRYYFMQLLTISSAHVGTEI
jgi:hypothetical protein